MSEVAPHLWTASDGVELAWHETGEGRPVVLLHGLFSDAAMNWIKFGHADKVAALGRRVIMPDLRAHGRSAKPHEAASYPRGILARDLRELVAHLGLSDFDLGGFSLGARTVVEAVGEGLKPGKAILAGMGLEGLKGWQRRKTFFLETIEQFDTAARGNPHWLAIQFMKTMKVDTAAAGLLLESFADAEDDWIGAFTMPTLVVSGSEDDDNGSARALAEALPDGTFAEIPGTHMSSVTKSELGEEMARFLRGLRNLTRRGEVSVPICAKVHSLSHPGSRSMKYAASVSLIALALAGCATGAAQPLATAQTEPLAPPPAVNTGPAPTAAMADAFVAAAEKELADLSVFENRAGWVNATYITDDTDWLSAKAVTEITKAKVRLATEAARFDGVAGLLPDTRRKLDILKQSSSLPPRALRAPRTSWRPC